VLEPLITLSVRVADEHFGGISAELSGRRGRVTGTDSPQPGWTEITSQVPMAEMDGFESRLKSISGGDGSCSIAFSHYEPALRGPATPGQGTRGQARRRTVRGGEEWGLIPRHSRPTTHYPMVHRQFPPGRHHRLRVGA
jgi:translation elongation factor EF-G